ncbi:MAG TPA: FGGY family carbohydrate kinase, partial [Anaerolinea sp.]|nr:FGGY family carbohydrate kinase [Anaerolinea sp.]
MSLLAGLDVGTTTLKAVLYDSETGRIVSTADEPTPVSHPRPEWSEHDPQQLWQAACRCLRAACTGKSVHALA